MYKWIEYCVVSNYTSDTSVVSAGWQLTINAFPHGQVNNIVEWKQWM